MLRGAGVFLGLPWLEALAPRRAWADMLSPVAPKRLAVLYMPNGVRPDTWTPQGEGTEFTLSESLRPLEELRSDISVYTNLWHKNSDFGDGHYVKTSGFLTGTTIRKTVGLELNCGGVSLDQVVAKAQGHHTPLPSLELGVEPVRSGVDAAVGYTQLYGGHISWSGPTMPLAKEINPRLAFERLVRVTRRGIPSDPGLGSILDSVREDAGRLNRSLGTNDQAKLEEYLESVRHLERQLDRLDGSSDEEWAPRVAIDPDLGPSFDPPEKHAERVRLLLEVMALAFQSDATRVSTFMFGNAVSGVDFSFLEGVQGTHHDLSHHENKPEKLAQYQKVNQWHVEQFARLLKRLKEMPEGESNVLDNSLILLGAGLRDGNAHSPHNLPIVLAGRAGGAHATGRHVVSSPDTPLSNLYLGMLRSLSVDAASFADSTGSIDLV